MGRLKKYFIAVIIFFLFIVPAAHGYLDGNSEVIKNAVSFLEDTANIDKFSISALGFGAMDLSAVNKGIPKSYKTGIIEKLNDTSVAGLGVAICGLRAMCENPDKIKSPKDFNGNGIKENLTGELLNVDVQNDVFSNSLILMGLMCSGNMNTLTSYKMLSFILNHQSENGKLGFSMDSHALAVMILEKYEEQNDDLVPNGVLEKAGEYLLNESSVDFNKTISAYGYTWNGFFPSATTTGLALGAISSLNLDAPNGTVEFLVNNANYLGFKDNYSNDQSFPNAEAFMGAMGKSYPFIPECKCNKHIYLRIEGLHNTKFNDDLDIGKCWASVFDALKESGINYSEKMYSFGAFVYAIDGETGDVNKNGGIVYYVDSGNGYEVPNVGMADYDLQNNDRVLIAVANETYSDYVPKYPALLVIDVSKSDEKTTVIVNDVDNNEIESAKVFYENNLLGETDSNGELEIDGLKKGKYYVYAEDFPKYIRSEKVKFIVNAEACEPQWVCTDWGDCIDNISKRECFDREHCGFEKPILTKKCVTISLDDNVKNITKQSTKINITEQNLTNETKSKMVLKSNVTEQSLINETEPKISIQGTAIIIAIILLGWFVAKLLKLI